MSAPAYGRGLSGLLKRGWNEIPEVMGSSFMGLIGISLGIAGYLNYQRKDGDNRKHKFEYIVVRSDDPRAQNLKK